MFVTFYDCEKKKQVKFMEEMHTVPCIGDSVMIGRTLYNVTNRTFSTDKPNRCCCYVEERKK